MMNGSADKAFPELGSFQRTADAPRRSDLAYEVIREAIAFGKFEPGQWLRQEALAEELNVSAVTVREAFNRLATEGLIVYIPYKGAKVVILPREELEDVWQMRALLEGFAWELSAGCIGDNALDLMRELLPRTVVGQELRGAEDAWRANREFHMIAVNAIGRRHLSRIVGQILDMTNPYFLLSEITEEERIRSSEGEFHEHTMMLKALEARDGKLARELATKHVLSTLEFLLEIMIDKG